MLLTSRYINHRKFIEEGGFKSLLSRLAEGTLSRQGRILKQILLGPGILVIHSCEEAGIQSEGTSHVCGLLTCLHCLASPCLEHSEENADREEVVLFFNRSYTRLS